MTKEKKINILHLRDSPWVDGPGRTILESGSRINPIKYGYFIGAFCNRNSQGNPFIDTAVRRKLKVSRIDESRSLDLTVLSQIKNLIVRENIDIIHTHEVRSDLFGLVAGKMAGVPVMTTVHGWIQNGIKGRILTKIDKCLLRFFDHVITVSEKMKDEVIRNGVKFKKVSVLHNALVIDNFQRNSESLSFRSEVGVGNETFLIGNIGRLSPEKGQANFIRSAAEVMRHYQNVKFLLVGIGNDKRQLEALANGLGLGGKVLFLGYRSDMKQIYNGLDLVVQSSSTEGLPNVILEALAMEVPVIATNVGGTSEIVENDVTGILIAPNNNRELTEKILKFIKQPDGMRAMAKIGAEKVRRKFDFNKRTERLASIYADLIAKKATI